MPPAPKDPGTRQRTNKASTKAVLSLAVDHDVPPLPPADDWIPSYTEDAKDTSWSPAVKKWWVTIWTSPMSNEFHESDIPQLYLAAFYLHQVSNPWLKISERLAAGKQHEAMVKNFGLNPMSRRTLQWEIEKVGEAQYRSKSRGSSSTDGQTGSQSPAAHRPDPRTATDEDEDNPFAQKRQEREAAKQNRKAGAS